MLRYLTAGESHGKALIAILEGIPAGLKLDGEKINQELKRRQQGFGRGKRMQIESDKVQVLSGVKNMLTLGSPITLLIQNKDYSIEKLHKVICPRPGHADLSGLLKYGFTDIREVLERASARSTAATVGVGAVCKILLNEFNIEVSSKVLSAGGENTPQKIQAKIAEAIRKKDTVGGVFEVKVSGVPVGLGSYVQPDLRLDAKISGGIMSIPGVKAVEIGLGYGYASRLGSKVHDAIYYSKIKGYYRKSNNAGGIEGGISNGQEIIVRACMKPICTLMNPLVSVNIATKRPDKAATERSDICVVEAAGVIAEAVSACVVAGAFLEKFGSDSLKDIRRAYQGYLNRIK